MVFLYMPSDEIFQNKRCFLEVIRIIALLRLLLIGMLLFCCRLKTGEGFLPVVKERLGLNGEGMKRLPARIYLSLIAYCKTLLTYFIYFYCFMMK